jgi:hypothetical protein
VGGKVGGRKEETLENAVFSRVLMVTHRGFEPHTLKYLCANRLHLELFLFQLL